MDLIPRQFRAPEIYGDFWFNSEPIPLGAMRGYVVLVHFWDGACAPSLRTLPYIKEWQRRYADKGLVTIGVHSPQFPFSRDPVQVRKFVERSGIRHAVVMDNEFMIWSGFRNTAWPALYTVDKDGFIRTVNTGEGSYQSIEHSLQSLLSEAGYRQEFPLVMEAVRETDRPGAVCYRATPEAFAGYHRGTIGNVEGFAVEGTSRFEDPGFYLEGRIYLHGDWTNHRDYLKLDESDGREGYLVVSYQAKDVNCVAKPEGENKFQVFVQQDGAFLTRGETGDDVQIDEDGRSYFLVTEPRLYSLVRNRDYGEHRLRLSSRSNGLALYSVSFVSCVIPEMVSRN